MATLCSAREYVCIGGTTASLGYVPDVDGYRKRAWRSSPIPSGIRRS